MNLASAGRPRIPLYGNGKSATPNLTFSVLKFSSLPNVTGSVIFPFGLLLPGLIPWNVSVSSSSLSGTWSFRSRAEEIRFKTAPPSTSILVTLRLRIVGETNIGKHPTAVVRSGWSSISKMIGVLDHFRSLRDSTSGSAALTSRTHCLSWRCEVCREAPPSTHKTSVAFWNSCSLVSSSSMSSSSSSSSSLSRPRGGLSPCCCLALPRRPPRAGRFVPDPPVPPWAFSFSRRSYSAFCSSTSCSTFLQLWRSWPLVRWILQYCLLVPSCLSATATTWQLVHAATSLPEPPVLAFLAPPSLPDCSTTSTSLPFFFMLFRRRFFFAGAASSLSDPPAHVFSLGSFLPSSARAHLSARAYSSLTSLILHITISSRILRLRTF